MNAAIENDQAPPDVIDLVLQSQSSQSSEKQLCWEVWGEVRCRRHTGFRIAMG
jgi:hypothetical protein